MIRKTAIARSIALAFGLATAGLTMAPTAFAQSNTTGTIYGTVESAAGAEVVVESKETGFKRTIKPDASGRFNLTSVPAGTYTVTLLRNGQVVSKQEGVDVRISQGSEVTLTGTQTVQIRASRIAKIDTTSATSAAVFTSKDLERLPVAGNVGAIIQLAPNTTKGDSRYGGAGAPSFGGASASENAYYINGFPVTTLLTQVGFAQLPFNSISQAQVLTGGYGAEFGRSTGGVVNLITKRGSNEWEVGGAIGFEPNAFRAQEKNIYYEPNGQLGATAATNWNGILRLYNGLNSQTRTTTSVYAGGPLIKDKLFFFGAFEKISTDRNFVSTANNSTTYTIAAATQATSFTERSVDNPRYLLKLDWAITDNHTLEFTRVQDKVKDQRKTFGFNYATLQRTNVQSGGSSYVNWGPTPVASQQGAGLTILKYTGYITDDLTVTALIGKTYTPHEFNPVGYDPSKPQINFANGQAPSLAGQYFNAQPFGNLLVKGAFDENKGKRFDFEYKLNSSHKLRAGIDYNTIRSYSGNERAGGSLWTYLKTDPLVPVDDDTAATSSVAGNVLGQQGYYVSQTITTTGAKPTVDQQAQYIEDQWQVNKDLLLILGLRNEGFDNKNGDGKSYIKLNRQLAPRLAAVWDVKGDASSVIKGTLGRYHVPLPTNAAIRGAGSSLNTTQNFVYTGIDPVTGAPTGLTKISNVYSANNEFGQAKDPRTVAAQDMKGNYQDELTLGIEQSVAKGWTGSAKLTYRTLRTAIDDHCDDRPFFAWLDKHPEVTVSHDWGYNCALFNPGIGNTFVQDFNLDGKLTTLYLSAADLGIPKVKRTYTAIDLGLEHAFDGKWWAKINYTLSRNAGNTEGQTLSDIGQADVATTQAFDFPEFSVNANGLLPNDRKHQLKMFGYYQLTEEFGFGGNMVFASGRPRNCIGNAPSTPGLQTPFIPGTSPVTNYSGYGSAYFFCDGKASPRGSLGRLSAEFTTDLNFQYTPSWMPGLKFKADVFNVFNRQVGEAVEERRHARGATAVQNIYGLIQSYSAPRSAKITVSYDKKF